MTTKDYFLRVRASEREIRLLRAKERHYKDLGFSISPKITGMPGSGQRGASRVEMAAVGMVDILADLQDQIKRHARIINEAENLISRIPQEKYRQLLTLRYLAGMSWPSISDEMGYKDRNSVYRAHGYALIEAKKVKNETMHRYFRRNDYKGNDSV